MRVIVTTPPPQPGRQGPKRRSRRSGVWAAACRAGRQACGSSKLPRRVQRRVQPSFPRTVRRRPGSLRDWTRHPSSVVCALSFCAPSGCILGNVSPSLTADFSRLRPSRSRCSRTGWHRWGPPLNAGRLAMRIPAQNPRDAMWSDYMTYHTTQRRRVNENSAAAGSCCGRGAVSIAGLSYAFALIHQAANASICARRPELTADR